jgi:hypothetical protein
MARRPDEEKAADGILAQLAELSAAARVAEAAARLQAEKMEAERAALVAQLWRLAEAQGYRPEDLFASAPPRRRRPWSGSAAKAQYLPNTGIETVNGGKTPSWLADLESSGGRRDEFQDGQPSLIEQA